jgi:WD40 repeat protein
MDENYTFETRLVTSIAWNSSGTHVAIGTTDWRGMDSVYVNVCLRIIDAASGKPEITVPTNCGFGINRIAWRNQNSEIVIITDGGECRRFDLRAGCSIINEWDIRGLMQSDFNPSRTQVASVVRRISWSHDHKLVDEPEMLEIYDIETGALLQHEIIPSDYHEWIGWSPDGTHLATTNRKGNVLIYHLYGNTLSFHCKLKFISDQESAALTCGAWGPDSRQLALINGYSNSLQSGIVMYDAIKNEVVGYFPESLGATPLAWSAELNLIAARPIRPGPIYPIRIWSGDTGQAVGESIDQYVTSLAWSPDGKLAVGSVIDYEEWLQDQTITGVNIHHPTFLPLA